MAAKPRFRIRSAALVAITTGIGFLVLAAAALADTGSVYVDTNANAAAGHDFFGSVAPSGSENAGLGYSVMPHLTSGTFNTALGNFALASNTAGGENVAAGADALAFNSTGVENAATGFNALGSNTTGAENVANGLGALEANTTGDFNLGTGTDSLFRNTTGRDNVAAGLNALFANKTGDSNVAIGPNAGRNLTTGSDNIDIGNAGQAGEAKAIRIGTTGSQTRTFIAGINGKTVSGTGTPVVVNSHGQLGTASAAKPAASKAATDHRFARMEAAMKRLQRQNQGQAKLIDRQGKEIEELRARG